MITAQIPYTVDTGEKLVNETFGPNNIRRRRSGGAQDLRPMAIEDGRAVKDELQLERNGFVFVEHKTAMKDFFDEAELKSVYYREVEELIKKTSGASRVVLFDHTLRSGDEGEREEKLIREPVLSAHNDYTEWSGPQRVRDLMGDEAEELLERRFAIIQVWRAINQPIQSNPLAIADARSVAPDDLMVAERRYPHRVGPDLSAEVQPQAPLVLFSADAARRGARVQGLRFGEGRPRALHAAHLVRRSDDAAGRAAAAEHRGAGVRFF